MKNQPILDVEFLNSLMIVKNLSERQFATLIGVSFATINRVLNGKRGAGNKVIYGILTAFPDVSYGQLIKHDRSLPKGNKLSKKSA